MDQNYVEILERTNQQLSLWFNPYGVMVAVLTALIALLAIAFAFILWRQGKEYRELFNAFIGDQKKIVETELDSMREQNQGLIQDLTLEVKEKLESETGDARIKLEKRLEELKSAEAKLSKPYVGHTIPVSSVLGSTVVPGVYGIQNLMSANTLPFQAPSIFGHVGTRDQRTTADLQAQIEALFEQVRKLQNEAKRKSGDKIDHERLETKE